MPGLAELPRMRLSFFTFFAAGIPARLSAPSRASLSSCTFSITVASCAAIARRALISLELKKLTSRALQGDLEIRIAGQVTQARLQYTAAHQLIYAAFTITATVGSLVLHLHERHKLMTAFAAAAGASGLLLLRSMWRARRLLREFRRYR